MDVKAGVDTDAVPALRVFASVADVLRSNKGLPVTTTAVSPAPPHETVFSTEQLAAIQERIEVARQRDLHSQCQQDNAKAAQDIDESVDDVEAAESVAPSPPRMPPSAAPRPHKRQRAASHGVAPSPPRTPPSAAPRPRKRQRAASHEPSGTKRARSSMQETPPINEQGEPERGLNDWGGFIRARNVSPADHLISVTLK